MINQLELLAILTARLTFPELFRDRQVTQLIWAPSCHLDSGLVSNPQHNHCMQRTHFFKTTHSSIRVREGETPIKNSDNISIDWLHLR